MRKNAELGIRNANLEPVPESEANYWACEWAEAPQGRDGSSHATPIRIFEKKPDRVQSWPIFAPPRPLLFLNVNITGGVEIVGYPEVIIQRCVIEDWETFGLKIRSCGKVRIEQCKFVGPGDIQRGGRGYGLLVEHTEGANVQGNTFLDCHIGVSGVGAPGLRVIENEGNGCEWIADLHVPNCPDAYIFGNIAPESKIGIGSWAWGGCNHRATVKKNKVWRYEIHGDADGTVIEHAGRTEADCFIYPDFTGEASANLDIRGCKAVALRDGRR